MGADQSLIKAAAQLAPVQWDYSGLLKGIATLGRYATAKRDIANKITTHTNSLINIKEMPDEFLNGQYGAQNMAFFTNSKKIVNDATNVMKNPLNRSGGKKYKAAVASINYTNARLERAKADLEVWAKIQLSAKQSDWQNMSKGNDRFSENILADIVVNTQTGEMNGRAFFGDDGGLNIIAGAGPYKEQMHNVNDLMADVKFDLVDDKVSKPLSAAIEKYGRSSQIAGDSEFQMNQASTEFNRIFKLQSAKGNDGLRSLAFDFQYGDESFVTSKAFSQDNEIGWNKNQFIIDYKKENPSATDEEINTAIEHTLADMWSPGSNEVLESKMKKWFVGLAQEDYNTYEKTSKSELLPTGNRLDSSKIDGIVDIINNTKSKAFFIQNIGYRYKDGKWQNNYSGNFENVVALGDGEEGDGLSLYIALGRNEKFDFLLSPPYTIKK